MYINITIVYITDPHVHVYGMQTIEVTAEQLFDYLSLTNVVYIIDTHPVIRIVLQNEYAVTAKIYARKTVK